MVTRALQALSARRSELNKNEKGFTLIELLVVVIIIGILAAIAIPIFLGQQDAAKDKAVAAAITNAKTAVVAELVAGKDIADIVTAGVAGLEAYTPSKDILVSIAAGSGSGATATKFVITGDFSDGAAQPGASGKHEHTITDKGAAVKTTP